MGIEVSVIVPTRNRSSLLADTLRGLLAQDFPQELYEVIVVDDGSNQPVQVTNSVRLVQHSRPRGPNAARNTGVRAARSNLLCFVDDDIEAPPGWLRASVEGAQRHRDVLAFAGRVRIRLEGRGPRFCDEMPLVAQGESELDFGAEEVIAEYACGCNLVVRPEAFEGIGFFREDHPLYFDETEWIDRLRKSGAEVLYLPSALIWHRRTSADLRLGARVRRAFLRGYGEAFTRSAAEAPFERSELARRLAGIPGLMLHSFRHRCTFGICASADEIGKAWWHLTGTRPRVDAPGR